jgi:hypothetical protein
MYFKVDGWTQSCISLEVLCKFVELLMMIEGSSC